MTLGKSDPRIELTDDRIADLKKAIADLAKAKRVSSDKLIAAEPVADHELSPLENEADDPLPSLGILLRHKWFLAIGVFGVGVGFSLSVILLPS
jgi:hypothetical protein